MIIGTWRILRVAPLARSSCADIRVIYMIANFILTIGGLNARLMREDRKAGL